MFFDYLNENLLLLYSLHFVHLLLLYVVIQSQEREETSHKFTVISVERIRNKPISSTRHQIENIVHHTSDIRQLATQFK